MFEATLHRSDPEATLRWVLAVVVVFVVTCVAAFGLAAGMVVRWLLYALLYLAWLVFGGAPPVLPTQLVAIEVVEVVVEEPAELEHDPSWDGLAELEPADLLGEGAPPPPEEPDLVEERKVAIGALRGDYDEMIQESGLLMALIGTTGDSQLTSVFGSADDVVMSSELSGGIGGLIGVKSAQIGSGGLGSRGSGLGGGGTAEGLGGLGTVGRGRGGLGSRSGSTGAAPDSVVGVGRIADRAVMHMSAAGSGADLKVRRVPSGPGGLCTVKVRPKQEPALLVSGCPSQAHRYARMALRGDPRASTRGTVTVLVVE